MGFYLRPVDLEEALRGLSGGSATVLAGGTDYYPSRVGRVPDGDVVDITAIAGLRGIRETEDAYVIGSLTTWSDVLSADLPPLFDGLKQAACEVGGRQIQNAGTIAGNLCNASAAADGTPCLMALDAQIELASQHGRRAMPVTDFVLDNRRTDCRPDELVTAVRIPRPVSAARSVFLKLGARRYLVISIVMVAATLESNADGQINAARIAVGACSPVARRLPDLEARLIGRPANGDLADLVASDDVANLSPIDDMRGTADYRADAAVGLVRRALAALGEAPS